jgi:hypothetical protein
LSEEDYEYYHDSFDSLWIYTADSRDFFIARAVNGGTACVHRDYMFFINSENCFAIGKSIKSSGCIYRFDRFAG